MTVQDRLRSMPADTGHAIRFLSRLPIPAAFVPHEQPDFARIAWTFPLAGLVIAGPAALLLGLAHSAGLPNTVCAILAIAALVVTTGALHEDGFADCADGFWGAHALERRLAIMRDSAIGTYGTLALIVSLTLRFALVIASLNMLGGWGAALALVAVLSLARLAMLWPWIHLGSVRPSSDNANNDGKADSGLSVRFGAPSSDDTLWAVAAALPALLLLLWIAGWVGTVGALAGLAIGTLAMTSLARTKIGGQTGDVLGATEQMAQMGLYLGLIAAI